ncbi:hypothetical protein ACFQ0K_18215 [Nocardioides caeni]|uniref:Uncharacterized protein n=1 Tax=Nocardioides caeni TaxID=574700 RepID=A0A4S8NB11_9ACTN|nr:hypothetical protein [Nocardioides caeni]THV13305.1 hypothetical protein E9934_10070 [Nocardioides caeni]
MNDHDQLLGPALRDRMRSENPDLERLAASSLSAGRRLRRRRTALVVAGTAAAVAGIGVGGALLSGGSDGTAVEDPGLVAGAPEPEGLAVGQVLDLGNGLTGTVVAETKAVHILGASTRRGAGTDLAVLLSGPVAAIETYWSGGFGDLFETWPGLTVAVELLDARALSMLGLTEEIPVTAPTGWTCEWFLMDDKASCTAEDGGVAGLVIRDAADHAAWTSDPDKGANADVFVTDVHDGIFISVQGGQGTTSAEIQELGASLEWID